MRRPIELAVFALAAFAASASLSAAGVDAEIGRQLRERIEAAWLADSLEVMDERVHARQVLQRAYTAREFRPFWVSGEGLGEPGSNFVRWLQTEPRRHGLRAADYHFDAVETLEDSERSGALVDLELALSDAFVMLGSHLLAGRLNPETLDPEWHADRRHRDLAPVIEKAAALPQPGEALIALTPDDDGYRALVARLEYLRDLRADGGWPTVDEGPTLREGDRDPRVAQLAARLGMAGDFEGEPGPDFTPELEAAVRKFQRRHGLNDDGVVGRGTLAALNVPVQARIDQIIVNLERWRWLPESLGERYILVNIAGFVLDVVEHGETALSMRVVVGQPYRRTPVFSGRMTYLVFNPSWEVPPRIAVRDKLPLIKADPAYLAAQGYTLLEGWGADERIIDPASVDWAALAPRDFRYRLRQSPGPLNALGRVKFMFPNEFSVYLHDTPSRELFSKESRSFSSGCIRLEHPLELAERLLGASPRWNRAAIDRVIATGRETTVPLPEPIPVHLLYWTAWVTGDDVVEYRDDVYGRDELVLEHLREEPPPPGADGA